VVNIITLLFERDYYNIEGDLWGFKACSGAG
jgi:hypothetical protein